MHVWLLGLCVIMSMRSEDKQAKVGAVLAQVRPKELAFAKENTNALEKMVMPSCCSRAHAKPLHTWGNTQTQFSIDVLGAGYNGSRKGALHRDYRFQGDDDKGKWVLHAEQNVFMFRSIDDTSKCTLYSTHSPCLQCSGIIREKQVKMVYFLDAYRPPPDLEEDRLCHHFNEKITRDMPIETLFRAIKEIKEGYPQIKRRLAKGYFVALVLCLGDGVTHVCWCQGQARSCACGPGWSSSGQGEGGGSSAGVDGERGDGDCS